jgi:hypothetical protein
LCLEDGQCSAMLRCFRLTARHSLQCSTVYTVSTLFVSLTTCSRTLTLYTKVHAHVTSLNNTTVVLTFHTSTPKLSHTGTGASAPSRIAKVKDERKQTHLGSENTESEQIFAKDVEWVAFVFPLLQCLAARQNYNVIANVCLTRRGAL